MSLRRISAYAISLFCVQAAWAQTTRPLPLGFEAAGSEFHARAQGYTVTLDGTGASLRLANARVLRFELEGSATRSIGTATGEEAGVASYFIGDDPSRWRRNVPQFSRVKYRGVYPGIDLIYYGQGRRLEFDAVVAPEADPGNVRLRFEGSDRIRSNHAGGLFLEAAGQQVELQAPVVYQTVNGSRRTIPASFVRHGNRRASLRIAPYDRALPLVIDPVVVTSTYIGGSGVDTASAVTADTNGNYYVVGSTSSADFPVTSGARTSPALSGYAAFIIKFNSSGAPVYSTYISGNTGDGNSYAYGVAVDTAGDAYIAGNTSSLTFPATTGVYQSKMNGTSNGFALELNPAGSALTYSTLFGGTGQDTVAGLAVDVFGNAFIGGSTTSSDFPTTTGAYQKLFGGGTDGFLVEVNPTGTGLGFATYLGASGQDTITGVALDGTGSPYVTGSTGSANFPVTPAALQPIFTAPSLGSTAFVAQFSFDGSALYYCTFLGGTGGDFAQAITLDLDGNVYVTGGTTSSDFPTTPGAYQNTNNGAQAVFASELDPTLSTLVASTYLGGSGQGPDAGYAIAVAPDGEIYIGGKFGPSAFSAADSPSARSGAPRSRTAVHKDTLTPDNDQGGLSQLGRAMEFVDAMIRASSGVGNVTGVSYDASLPVPGVLMSGNGAGAIGATNTPAASLSENADPPYWAQFSTYAEFISVTQAAPKGSIYQGDQVNLETTITNLAKTPLYIGIIGRTGYQSAGGIGANGAITSFVDSTAGQSGFTECQLEVGDAGYQGYSCGVTDPAVFGVQGPDAGAVQLQAGASLIVTDTYYANFSSNPQRQDTGSVKVFWANSLNLASGNYGYVEADQPFPVLPPLPGCTSNCPATGTTPQQITVMYLPPQTSTLVPFFTFAATPTSGLPVTAVTADPNVCIITPFPNGETTDFSVQLPGATGTCIFSLDVPGNAIYAPASVTEALPVFATLSPITVTKNLASPTGDIHQGDNMIFTVTITNTSKNPLGIGAADHAGHAQLMDTSAPDIFHHNFFVTYDGPTAPPSGYKIGLNGQPLVLPAESSIVITDKFQAISSGDDANVASVYWWYQDGPYYGLLPNNGHVVEAQRPFKVLPPASCGGSAGAGPRSAFLKRVEATAGGASCPVSGDTPQTIDFPAIADQAVGSAPVILNATATSQLPVTYSTSDDTVCSVTGSTVTIIGVGSCFLTAAQLGNSTYRAAVPVAQVFFVDPQPVAGFLDQNGAPALTSNGSTSFPDAGGFLIAAPGVTQDLSGNVYIVGLDGAGGVHLNSFNPDPGWNGWQYSGGILDTTSGLTAAVDPSGTVWFTGRDIGNRFWINSWNGSIFGGWILVADGIFAPDSIPQIAIPSDGTIYVVGKDIGGRIWTNSYDPIMQTFTGWVDRQGVIYGQPSVTAGQDGMVYVAVRSVASESPVYIMQIPAKNAATATTFLNGGGQIDTDPQITSQGGIVYLLAEADGNTVYLQTFSESSQTYGGWNFTNGILNDTTIAAAGGNVFIAGRDSADRIYWYSVTGNSWFFAGGAGISSTVLTGGK